MLPESDRATLLAIARAAITAAAHGEPLPKIDLNALSPLLREPHATFVTLNLFNELRGCIGGLYATMPLALDVQEHAAASAMEDPRFPPVRLDEVPYLCIEISVLTTPELVPHRTPEELLAALRPGIDGIILRPDWAHRATFLPQVWIKVPDPVRFLRMLSEKAGVPPNTWQLPETEVYRYQVETFEEPRITN